jgi:penicillin-binding protein 1C
MILRRWKGLGLTVVTTLLTAAALLSVSTVSNLKPVPDTFQSVLASDHHMQVLDRTGEPLNITYQNNWNIHDVRALHDIPEFLKSAFVTSEDKRFYGHNGPDWRARSSALVTNVKSLSAVRGASTITEQSVRMLHPRPRTVWSRWLEGFEAGRLETAFSKQEILEFYLNQVPYAANRRGVAQAAQYYFDRDLATLSQKEMLALVVLVRAPSRMDLWKNTDRVEASIERLTDQLIAQKLITKQQKLTIVSEPFDLQAPNPPVPAQEFVAHVKSHPMVDHAGWPKVKASLDAHLQSQTQTMLDQRLHALRGKNVHNGAVLALDHTTGEILVWAVAGKDSDDTPGKFIDAVTAPRQPGSALKPFLYALALEKGWTPATIIDDAPLIESVGNGLHAYQNYSRSFYGEVTLRQALGNSLNIPALKALQYVGAENYLDYLRRFGFSGLSQHPNFYGDGIALGNGEVTLLELVSAYAVLANGGTRQPLTPFPNGLGSTGSTRAISPELASLMGNILSDAGAREKEFGAFSVLNFPVQTAVKTGTSSDYRDSWAVGFNYRYTVGVWMGNLDQRPTDGLTGSIGPALLLRSVFSELDKYQETEPLKLHRKLVKYDLCTDTHNIRRNESCPSYSEWFLPGTKPVNRNETVSSAPNIRLRHPTNNLHIAYDPRVPAGSQAFEFHIEGLSEAETVVWNIDGRKIEKAGGKYAWPVQKGEHVVYASVWRDDEQIAGIQETRFLVK